MKRTPGIIALIICIVCVLTSINGCSDTDGGADTTAEEKTPETAVLTYSSFDGGGPEYVVEIADEDIVSYDEEHVYFDKNHESQRGSGYKVVLTFKGLKQGITSVRVTSVVRSEVEFYEYYEIVVDGSLNVYATQVDYSADTKAADDETETEAESTESETTTTAVTEPVPESKETKETKEEKDPYNASDYATPEDFYYDYYDDFYDYDEAEEYWEEHCD